MMLMMNGVFRIQSFIIRERSRRGNLLKAAFSSFSVKPNAAGSFTLKRRLSHPYKGCRLYASNTQEEDETTLASSLDDTTIFALSSGNSRSGQASAVAVIRISGPQSGPILQRLTNNTVLPKPRVAALRNLHDPQTQSPLDQALVLYFQAPASFTGQDVVELHCHGSRAVIHDVLECVARQGARLAEPGEFTQRAWLAGKLNVLQIEALADLLAADTKLQRVQALRQLDGTKLSRVYHNWRTRLIAGLAHAEAVIDFGDDEALGDELDHYGSEAQQDNIWGGVTESMKVLRELMQKQLQDARRGELVREGLQIAIIGPPNAGKSSLFNLLANRDAAIVSPTAGTTRDILEVTMNLGGVKCILQDTAGVRTHTDDVIELEGMKRAAKAATQADMVVAMIDTTDCERGLSILRTVIQDSVDLDPKHVLLVLNKSDLKTIHDSPTIGSALLGNDFGRRFEISCVTQAGIDGFLETLTSTAIARVLTPEEIDNEAPDEGSLITRARHRQHVLAAVEALERFQLLSMQGTISADMAAEELRLAASELGRITGAVDVEDILDKLFADFCIGK
jgi:tRNA modification GTPase